MASSDGGPAFPTLRENRSEGLRWVDDGMSLRDYIAIEYAARFAIRLTLEPKPEHHAQAAKAGYEFADAMLAEREKRHG